MQIVLFIQLYNRGYYEEGGHRSRGLGDGERELNGEREASTGRGKKKKMGQHKEWVMSFGFVPTLHFLVSRSYLLVTSRSEGCDECQSVAVFVFKIIVT